MKIFRITALLCILFAVQVTAEEGEFFDASDIVTIEDVTNEMIKEAENENDDLYRHSHLNRERSGSWNKERSGSWNKERSGSWNKERSGSWNKERSGSWKRERSGSLRDQTHLRNKERSSNFRMIDEMITDDIADKHEFYQPPITLITPHPPIVKPHPPIVKPHPPIVKPHPPIVKPHHPLHPLHPIHPPITKPTKPVKPFCPMYKKCGQLLSKFHGVCTITCALMDPVWRSICNEMSMGFKFRIRCHAMLSKVCLQGCNVFKTILSQGCSLLRLMKCPAARPTEQGKPAAEFFQ
jgi:hypothetical protein